MSTMRDADMSLIDRIEAAIKRITSGEGAMRVPAEATDPDVVLRDCQQEIERLREALTFYAEKGHFILSDDCAWDTVSGEPPNYWCDEAGTATVEDGSIARLVLAGESVDLADDEDALAKDAEART